MNKPRPIHLLKAAALTATLTAAAALGLQLGNGHTNPITLTFTVLAVLLTGIALADDTARTFRRIHTAVRRHRTTTPNPPPPAPQPATDDEARMRVLQIIGSDIDGPDIWTGDWHHALQTTSARWTPTRRQRIRRALHLAA